MSERTSRTTVILEEPIRIALGHMAVDQKKTKTQIFNAVLSKELRRAGYL